MNTTASAESENQIEKLIELNDELENYFRNTIIPQLFVDANFILRKFTPPAMKQFKFSSDHIGRPIQDLVDNIRYSTIVENIREVVETAEILEKEIQTTDMRWFQMNIIPYIVKKDNRNNGVIITFIDITDRIKVLKDLERLNLAHETFIYSVSHDLKGPLVNIEGLVTNILESTNNLSELTRDPQEYKMLSAMLITSVGLMRKTINELTEISKIEGNYIEETETIELESLFNEVELTLKDKFIESNARVVYDIQVGKIEFSRKSLRSILFNLLGNAIKYSHESRNPFIRISVDAEDDFIRFSIKDNGIGISQENLDQLFAKYTRLHTKVEGSGIGLYLIKKLVENAGGKIVVTSSEGEGSEFIVYLKG